MTWEEEAVNAALWSGLSDAELGAIVDRIVAEIGPVRMREWNERAFIGEQPARAGSALRVALNVGRSLRNEESPSQPRAAWPGV